MPHCRPWGGASIAAAARCDGAAWVQVHVAAWVRVGPASLYVPVKVEDLQLDALARITFRPLVDKLPCIGAVSVALMDTPFIDLTLKLINDWDIMSLPFIHDAVLMGAKIGAEPVRPACSVPARLWYELSYLSTSEYEATPFYAWAVTVAPLVCSKWSTRTRSTCR